MIEDGRKRDDGGWDGWMASPIQWTWLWENSGSWWWTVRSGVLQSIGSQKVGHTRATELNSTELDDDWGVFPCSVAQSCVMLCSPMDCRISGFPVLHYLLEFAQTHVYWVSDANQPSHPLSSPTPPALNLSQHQGLFQWVSSSHQLTKVLECQIQLQSFQWIFRVDFL